MISFRASVIVSNHVHVAAVYFADDLAGNIAGWMEFYAAVDADHAGDHVGYKSQIMGDHQNGHALVQALQQVEQEIAHGRVDIGGGFVQ